MNQLKYLKNNSSCARTLFAIYRKLYNCFGPQHWWPAETPFEVTVGAILTQNTSWKNVEKALGNMKQARCLSAQKLYGMQETAIARMIRPAGYFNIKARRLKRFIAFFVEKYHGSIASLRSPALMRLREELLGVYGVGPETADSILLYALDKPIFVIDAYTKRILSRHGLIADTAHYEQVQAVFMDNLKPDARLFNEYHALIVKTGKDYCLKTKPRCADCPLGSMKPTAIT